MMQLTPNAKHLTGKGLSLHPDETGFRGLEALGSFRNFFHG
jgi:hypothetical protein